MSYLPTERKIFYYEMEGSRYLFADERIKMHLLERISELRQRDGWLLFAFCIIDDRACFVIEAARIASVVRALQSVVRKQLQQPEAAKASQKTRVELSGRMRQLNTLPEIADCCREVHQIPLRRGYVCRLEDYWWSSYPSYMGFHQWDVVDRRLLTMYFSVNPGIARKKLRQFHAVESGFHTTEPDAFDRVDPENA
ncbi:MAG: hypothetical protein LUH00_10675 [Lachnospiraceae bacterium]|nr:hypothetical protein [Lachnospiraceae bacterium]